MAELQSVKVESTEQLKEKTEQSTEQLKEQTTEQTTEQKIEQKTYYLLLDEDYKDYHHTYSLGLNTCDKTELFALSDESSLYSSMINDKYKYIAIVKIPPDAEQTTLHYVFTRKIFIESFVLISEWPGWNDPNTCLTALKADGSLLKYIKRPTWEMRFNAVKQDGLALQYVPGQNKYLCLEACRQNGNALQHVKDQDAEICLEACKQNGNALQYVKEQNPNICLEAMYNSYNREALQYVKPEFKYLFNF